MNGAEVRTKVSFLVQAFWQWHLAEKHFSDEATLNYGKIKLVALGARRH